MSQQPPYANGIMDLSVSERKAIKAKLVDIRDAFVPTEETAVADTFYLVSTYNQQNPSSPINGDTAEHVLAGE